MEQLNAKEKEILDNLMKAIPKLSDKQKEKLLTGSKFILAMTECQRKTP